MGKATSPGGGDYFAILWPTSAAYTYIGKQGATVYPLAGFSLCGQPLSTAVDPDPVGSEVIRRLVSRSESEESIVSNKKTTYH